MLQTHLNDLAKTLSQARVQHARFYFKAIFEEAIEQDLVQKNPARKLILPNGLRAPDKTTLSWDQLRRVPASVPLRDCILLKLDMTGIPAGASCLRCGGGASTWTRARSPSASGQQGQAADFGKTKKSLRTVHLPEGLATELWLWRQDYPDRSAEAFIFPNARKRNGSKTNGFIRTDNYRSRPRVLKKLAAKLGLAKLNFQVLRRTMATLAPKGGIKDVQGVLGHNKADTTVNVYMQLIEAGVKSTLDAIYSELTAREEVAAGS